jgi:transcriptional accessory protein Tex/SPT6
MNLQTLSTKYDIGAQTLSDILAELARPGRDPRDDLDPPAFASDILDIKDLTIGMTLQGIVRNITDFGAFVDIGLHSDGLVHKSQMADRYVAHPMDVVSLGQQVSVRVVDIDLDREKVALSMKSQDYTPPARQSSSNQNTNNREVPLDKEGGRRPGDLGARRTEDLPKPPVEIVSEIKSNIKRG